MYGAFWDASIYADEQMTENENWADSDEGRLLLGLINRESERLQAIIDSRKRTVACLRCGKLIPYQQGTCQHCGYKEF
jgi:ribosomal protein L40E